MEKSAISTAEAARPPQFSGMFQKLALAVRTKTFELFSEEVNDAAATDFDAQGFALLDSAEDFITVQKVVVIKPDRPFRANAPTPGSPMQFPANDVPTGDMVLERKSKPSQLRKVNTQTDQILISSVLAALSSFEASYLQLQAAHAPFREESVKAADRALISHLQRLSDLKRFYKQCRQNSEIEHDLAIGTYLESQVQENQSKLRALEIVSNRLQGEIDERDLQVWTLRNKLDDIQKSNSKLSKKLSANARSSTDILLSVRLFESLLEDACKATRKFSKILIELMRKAGWDLDLASNAAHPDIDYCKNALLSYVFLEMFRGFDADRFDVEEVDDESDIQARSSLRELTQHVSSNSVELLNSDKHCKFSRFCKKKYGEVIHPKMTEAVMTSWRSLNVFYESFVEMSSSIWSLHKLALSFHPKAEIFRVERGADFSMVYMNDVLSKHHKKLLRPGTIRPKVAFTVVPGFKVASTIIRSAVYLNGSNGSLLRV